VAALESLLHARLLIEKDDATYHFAHDLIREVAAADLGAWRRHAAHRIVAEALEASLSERERELRAAELAQHFVRGGEVARALPYLERAGERAQGLYANAEAERIYRELLRLNEEIDRPLDAARAEERLAQVLTTVGQHEEAIALLTCAAHRYQQAGDLDSFARSMALAGRAHATNGTYDVGTAELEAVVRTTETEAPSHGRIAVHTMLTLLYWTAGAYGKQAAAARQAVELARALGHDGVVAWTESLQGMAFVILGRLRESVPLLQRSLPPMEVRGDAENIFWVLGHLLEAYACMGSLDQCLHYSVRGLEVAEQWGNPISIGNMWYWLGLHAFYTGDWQRAHRCFDEGCSVARRLEHSRLRDATLSYPLLGLGVLSSAQEESELGRQYLDQALALARRGLPPRNVRPIQGYLAERGLLAGCSGDALERLDALFSSPEDREGIDATPLLPLLAWAHLEAGHLAQAEEITREAVDRCRVEHHQLALLDALLVQALLAIHYARWGESATALDEALELAHAMPHPYAEAKALFVYGKHYAASGQVEDAREQYEAALMILRLLGERLYAEHIEQALALMPSGHVGENLTPKP
jgi:tetratricopeptide (TPR) repeat protein